MATSSLMGFLVLDQGTPRLSRENFASDFSLAFWVEGGIWQVVIHSASSGSVPEFDDGPSETVESDLFFTLQSVLVWMRNYMVTVDLHLFYFSFLLQPHLWHMEVPRLGV